MPPRRFNWIYTAPILAIVALLAWAFASPVGAAPDDDFHLVSTWCGSVNTSFCLQGEAPDARVVAEALVEAPCFAFDPEQSATCQAESFTFDATPTVETERGNFVGAYPPVFYFVQGLFVGENIAVSAVLMRIFNILLFVGLTSALYALLPVRRRPTLLWAWLITAIPLGLFLISSNNPSGWAVTGVGTAWLALLGYFETVGRRRLGLAAIFILGVLMAAGSRGDAAFYSIGAIAVVMLIAFVRTRQFALLSILPVVMALVALAFFVSSRQVSSGVDGMGGAGSVSSGAKPLGGFGLLAFNVLNAPWLWSGVFGTWGLGWLDTSMPWIVPLAGIAVFVAVGFAGLALMTARKAVAIGGVGFVLWALPVYVLTAGGDGVGAEVQPRYLLPLLVLFAGLLVLAVGDRWLAFSRVQAITLFSALSVANFVALHINIRRYVTGVEQPGVNLSAGAEWWWDLPFSPTLVWLVGSAAFAALVFVVIRDAQTRPKLEASEL